MDNRGNHTPELVLKRIVNPCGKILELVDVEEHQPILQRKVNTSPLTNPRVCEKVNTSPCYKS